MSLEDFMQPDQVRLLELVARTKGKGRAAVNSCLRSMDRSFQLLTAMPEVSTFLAITAYEEAAVAIFRAMEEKGYSSIDRINIKKHDHKTGLYPYLQMLWGKLFPAELGMKITLSVEPDEPSGKERLVVRQHFHIEGRGWIDIEPTPPLGLISQEPDGSKSDYAKKVKEAASERDIRSLHSHIRRLANERNLLLYATEAKVPTLTEEAARKRFFHFANASLQMLIVYQLIATHGIQSLAKDALEGYVKIISRDG